MTEHMPPQIAALIDQYGNIGLFIAMFLESSVIPIPSEVVIAAAGAMGLPLVTIVVYGSLGSTLGGMVGYAIGRFAGLPLILKFGRFLLLKPHHIEKAQNFSAKYGAWGVFLGRVLPVVPFKVFSIASGMAKVPFGLFILGTIVGVVPRLVVLSYFGKAVVQYTKPTLLVLLVIGIIGGVYWLIKKKKAAQA
ncbi:MAG: DedA family protein [Candidatus Omnitrophica bacterium]|nr:DedA family protein [Candidatus Omnitrophota bacterium]